MIETLTFVRPSTVGQSAPLSLDERMKNLAATQKKSEALEKARADFSTFILTQITNDAEKLRKELEEPVKW